VTPGGVPAANEQVFPRISVVIPCHNYGRYLAATIESVRRQRYPSVELIVVDDGSTDDSAEIASGYAEVICLRQQNQGQAAAQNRGLEAAGGSFVVFLDADDELTGVALETLLQCLLEQPECAFAYGHIELIGVGGEPILDRPDRSAKLQTCVEGDPYAHMLRTNNGIRSSGAIMYRTDVLRAVGGFTLGLGNAQDVDLNLRLARDHRICCNDRIVLSRRLHDANSTLRFAAMLRGAVEAQRGQREFVRRHPSYGREYRAGLRLARSYWGSRLARAVVANARAGELRAAGSELLTLARYAPRAGALEIAHLLFHRP
jgi:glycosyltransferase involved in cell wall biosynthesis